MRRRDFVTAAAMLPFAASTAGPAPGWRGYETAIVINNLGGLVNPNLREMGQPEEGPRNPDFSLDARLLRDLAASGLTAVNLTIGHVAGPGDPFEKSVDDIAYWDQVIRHNAGVLVKVETTADILAAKTSHRAGIILGFQNTTMLGSDAERVAIFSGLGVRIIQLTYNDRNLVGDGSMVPENHGLTPFGHEVVERLNATNTLIDLSHSGEATCLDAIRSSKRPICISHTGCRALVDLPRNKSDAELKLLADKGGLVGIYFMPFLKDDSFPDAHDAVRHIEHAITVCGEDHVGIGTDGGTTAVDNLESYRAIIAREVAERQAAGIAAKGEKAGVVTFLPDLQGPEQFQRLANLLGARGHSDARIEKILGANSLRLMRDVWGA